VYGVGLHRVLQLGVLVVGGAALTRFTVTFGYCFLNAVTTSLACGAHAHTVIVAFFCRAAAICAADVFAEAVDGLGELLEHAVAAVEMAKPIAMAASAAAGV